LAFGNSLTACAAFADFYDDMSAKEERDDGKYLTRRR